MKTKNRLYDMISYLLSTRFSYANESEPGVKAVRELIVELRNILDNHVLIKKDKLEKMTTLHIAEGRSGDIIKNYKKLNLVSQFNVTKDLFYSLPNDEINKILLETMIDYLEKEDDKDE